MSKGESSPPQDGRRWVRADDAAKMVGLTREYFVERARRMALTRYQPPQRSAFGWYLRCEIDWWAELERVKRSWVARHRRSGRSRWTEAIEIEEARTGSGKRATVSGRSEFRLFDK